MGNDGGSIPDRRDLVRSKPKAEQADKANQTRARWFFCALSKKPLQEPVVSCALGKLYNKDALLEYLLDRAAYGDGEEICGHIRSLKDVKTLKLTHNPVKSSSSGDGQRDVARFVCPLNLKEMNGSQPFVYIWTCGCVFSQAGLRVVSKTPPSSPEQKEFEMCPQCGAKYGRDEDVLVLNPQPEEEEKMILAMGRRRAAEPAKSKSKGNKKRKAAAQADEEDVPAAKKKHNGSASPAPLMNPTIAAASRAVVNSLAEEEAKRKAGMSEAVKSLYHPKDGVKKKETFMTMGTFTRYA
ncbi:hypothetical protein NLI96_g6236 [Meripilus lineatus]|uniref:Replication termination factor 2 n=1 Tax=Meripilus lineatus TaxID=2056292 RepID=A0AAD5YI96_9APHY|nr:hypothetical protein NLI96_g6236 [Physisporinus lineatus]